MFIPDVASGVTEPDNQSVSTRMIDSGLSALFTRLLEALALWDSLSYDIQNEISEAVNITWHILSDSLSTLPAGQLCVWVSLGSGRGRLSSKTPIRHWAFVIVSK